MTQLKSMIPFLWACQNEYDVYNRTCNAEGGKSEAVATEVGLTDIQMQRNKEQAERNRQIDGILFNVLQTVSAFPKLLNLLLWWS